MLDDGGEPKIADVIAETIRKWRFKPGILAGQPAPTCWHEVLVVRFVRAAKAA
jgi:hypothetical protein